jgi:hypothetical protein
MGRTYIGHVGGGTSDKNSGPSLEACPNGKSPGWPSESN